MFRTSLFPSIFLACTALLLATSGSLSQAIVDNSYCNFENRPLSLRQTIVVIDGNLVVSESGAPLQENQDWRSFATQFANPQNANNRQSMDARERISIAVSNPDGSGLRMLFSGCVPSFRVEEEAELDSNSSITSIFESFVGMDWRATWKKNGEKFGQKALSSLITGIKDLSPERQTGQAFSDSTLLSALSASPGYSLERGVPRLIVYTDLNNYTFPAGDVAALRQAGRADAERLLLDLLRAEVHIVGMGSHGNSAKEYLDSLFLAGKGQLVSLVSASGAINDVAPPRKVTMYQGIIDLAQDVQYPLRMRLALDGNGSVVNSWVEMQGVQNRFSPFAGIVNCSTENSCQYVGDGVFSRVWSENPLAERPDCAAMPFGGLRNLRFSVEGENITGLMSDEVCFFADREDGVSFELTEVVNGVF